MAGEREVRGRRAGQDIRTLLNVKEAFFFSQEAAGGAQENIMVNASYIHQRPD